MPGHIKSSIFGSFLWIPIKDGKLSLGSWQGINLGEHRINEGNRSIVITMNG
tara:strand:+ start:152 stop:307 length:156 start_codon:yes stop_codon:yes gene_type:complete